MNDKMKQDRPSRNPDLITNAPGSHPFGTGLGAAAGGAAGIGGAVAAGAAMGSVVGPVGTAVGAAIGAVAGGLIGKGVAEGVNPTDERDYWQKNYTGRPYVKPGTAYDEYAPAYQYGWEAQQKHAGKEFNEVESDLARGWDKAKGKSALAWEHAKHATRDSWERVRDDEHAL